MSAAIIAALPGIFKLIELAGPGVQHLIEYVFKVREALSQSSEWTVELQADFIAALVKTKTAPEYQPDSPAN